MARETLQEQRDGDPLAAPFAVPRRDDVPSLAEMALAALNVVDGDPDGFCLLIEGGAVDWASHDGRVGRMIEEMTDFNRAVEAVLAGLDERGLLGETLVVVTADHECGHLAGPVPSYVFLTGEHTNSLVPLFARGPGSGELVARATETDPVRGPYLDNCELGAALAGGNGSDGALTTDRRVPKVFREDIMNDRFPTPAARGAVVFLTAILALLAAGCASGPPRVGGVDGVSPAPDTPWIPPASAAVAVSPSEPAIPPEAVAERLANLTLAEVVDIALANSPATREAWANAKAAAAGYGSARGTRLPSLDGTATLARGNTTQNRTTGGASGWSTTYGPGATLSWQLLDFGGRAGRVEAAKQALLAADWTHNAVIQDAVLDVVTAFYRYGGAKAILAANRVSCAEADSSLAAAEARHEVGLATIADVLQARTARAQVKLDLQTTEGQVRTTRGALAVSMGYPANAPYDIEIGVPDVPVDGVAHAVDELIAGAVAARPDLRAAQAQALAAAARVRSARADLLPSLSVSGSTSRTWTDGVDDPVDRTGGALTLSIPLFGGFSGRHELARARAEADAAAERARGCEQQRGLRDLRRAQRLPHRHRAGQDGRRAADQRRRAPKRSRSAATARAWATSWTCCRRSARWPSARAQQVNARLGLVHLPGAARPRRGRPGPARRRIPWLPTTCIPR